MEKPSRNLDVASILSSLDYLKRSQLEDIRRRCLFLLQHSGPVFSSPMEEEDWLLLGIIAEAKRRVWYIPTGFTTKKSRSFGSFPTKSLQVRNLLESAAAGVSLVERRYLGQVAAKALADYLPEHKDHEKDGGVKDARFSNALMHVDWTISALERAYPGYLEAGLLGLVVRKENA